MKKLIIFLPLFIGILWSCNPMKDTYNELDSKEVQYNEKVTYTLVTSDYATATKAAYADATNKADSAIAKSITTLQAFNSRFTGKNYVGSVLAKNYPALLKNSSATVTYNENLNDIAYLTNYTTGSIKYTVSNANYSSVGGKVALAKCFTPAYPADSYLPGFLSAGVSSPAEGALALVTYNATDIEPNIADIPTITAKFSDDFESGTLSKYVPYSVTGAQTWASSSYGGTQFAKISGYSGGNNNNEDWLIIPAVDLSSAVVATLSFSSAHKYAGNNLVLKYSTDYDGSSNPNDFTWTALSFNMEAGTGSFLWTPSGSINIPGMPNNNVSIAFVYTSTTSASSTWEIDNILLNYKNSNAEIPVKSYNNFYKYTGSAWAKATNVICVQPFEYESMGAALGVTCFSTSNLPATYLPTFLKAKFPFALEGDKKVVAYNYNSSGTINLMADEYRYVSGTWSTYSGITQKIDQFVHSGEKWAFDPTQRISATYDDYMLLVNYVYTKLSATYGSSYKNDEFYYGASAHYLNWDLRLSNKTTYNIPGYSSLSTDAEKIALTWSRLQEGLIILLQLKYPAAVTSIDGITVYYWVTFSTYENDLSKKSYVGIFKCTVPGTTPTFERDKAFEDEQVASGNLTSAQVNWNRP